MDDFAIALTDSDLNFESGPFAAICSFTSRDRSSLTANSKFIFGSCSIILISGSYSDGSVPISTAIMSRSEIRIGCVLSVTDLIFLISEILADIRCIAADKRSIASNCWYRS